MALAEALRGACEAHKQAPPEEDKSFWEGAAKACGMLADGPDPDAAEEVVTELAEEVKSELDNCQVTPCGSPQLWVGDLTSSESRLTLMTLGIRGVVYIASHGMEPLWEADGIKYETLIVSPAIEPSKTITSQLPSVCAFLRERSPALVCSSSSSLRALVCAARAQTLLVWDATCRRAPPRDAMPCAAWVQYMVHAHRL